MALTRITSLGLADGAIQATDIADSVVTTAKIADNAVTTVKINDGDVTSAKLDPNGSYSLAELSITGSSALQLPVGTDAERPLVLTNGLIRFNTTSSRMEVYNETKAKWEAGGGGAGGSADFAYFISA